jgi:hypothetical protein
MTLGPSHDQVHDTSLSPVYQFCEISLQFMNSVKSYDSDLFKNHYVCSDLDLWPVTLDQFRDTSLGPV